MKFTTSSWYTTTDDLDPVINYCLFFGVVGKFENFYKTFLDVQRALVFFCPICTNGVSGVKGMNFNARQTSGEYLFESWISTLHNFSLIKKGSSP